MPELVFLSSAQRRLFERGLPVFVLHKLARPPAATRDPFDYMRSEVFDAKLAALINAGLRPVSLDAALEAGSASQRGFVVTFDDGYRNVFENGLAALARHKVTALQFLVAARLGQRNEWDIANGEAPESLMDEAQVRDWLAAGHQIGSHGLAHRVLHKLTEPDAREEIFSSKKRLEDRFGVPVRHFSYPSGRYSPLVRDLVQSAGYATACTVEFGVNLPETSRFELRRISPLYAGELLRKAWHRLWRKLR